MPVSLTRVEKGIGQIGCVSQDATTVAEAERYTGLGNSYALAHSIVFVRASSVQWHILTGKI